MVVFVNVVVLGQKWLYSSKVVVFGKSGCIRAKCCFFWQQWFYSGKSGCIRARGLYLGKIGCIRANLLFSGKVVVSRERNWLFSVNRAVFGQK